MQDMMAKNIYRYFATTCRLFLCASMAVFSTSGLAAPLEHLTYLLPAPKDAIVFAPFVLAEHQGLYAAQGLAVTFTTVQGGAKVGEALQRGEGDLGGALGDTPILLRERGIQVKGVALLGGHAFLTLMSNQRGALYPNALKGKTIAVPSFTDISFYALESLLRTKSLESKDVQVLAKPPRELWESLGNRQVDAIVGTVDWGVRAERLGVTLAWRSIDHFYPAMAQAIMAADAMIATQPDKIERFVKATLQAMALIAHEPQRAAALYRAAMPGTDFSAVEVARIFSLLGAHVYSGQLVPGAFDEATVRAMQEAYFDRKLITVRRDPDALYTNSFVH